MSKKQNDDSVKKIYQYLLQHVSVSENDLMKRFGKDFELLLEKGFNNLEALGYIIRVYRNDEQMKSYVIGLPPNLENENIPHNSQLITVFFVIAYYIYKHPEEKVILDEIEHVFKEYLRELDEIIKVKKWLKIRDNYLYLDPKGKFVLMNYIKKNPDTGNRNIVEMMEKLY